MSDTFTNNLGLQVPTIGGDSGNWGNVLNTDLALIDNSIAGQTTLTLAGQANVTFSFTAGGADQFKQPMWILNGTAANPNTVVTLPAIAFQRWYLHQVTGSNGVTFVLNGSSGSQLTIGSAQENALFLIVSDGTNIYAPSLGANIAATQNITTTSGNLITSSGNVIATNGTITGQYSAIQYEHFKAGVFYDNTTLVNASSGGTVFPTAIPLQILTTSGGYGSTLSSLTVNAGGVPTNSMVLLDFTFNVTALTITGGTVINAPSSIAAGKVLRLYNYNNASIFCMT